MSYHKENELWYLVGQSCTKVQAMVNAVQSKSEMTTTSSNIKNKVAKNNKVEAYSGYLKDYKASTKEDQQQTAVDKNKKIQPKLMDINEAHQKFGHISERMLKITVQRDNLVFSTLFCLSPL
jgi:hypothetical protein